MEGCDWLVLIKEIPQGLSIDRVMAMNRKDIEEYFNLLSNVPRENNLLDQLGHVYNMNEAGFQMNPRSHTVIAEKGSPILYKIISGEKEETISVIACCNTEGCFIPPACILKTKNKKPE
jgi:hypothetical protein